MSKEAKITVEELQRSLQGEMQELLDRVAQAMNDARAGAIIADSEEPVHQAVASFRQRMYERAVHLMADKAAKAAFSPSGQSQERTESAKQGHPRRGAF